MSEATTWIERWIVHLVWLLLGAALAYLLIANPLGLGWLSAGEAEMAPSVAADAAVPETLWTCSMDPHVLEHEPGNCPVCGMKLVPLKVGSAATVSLDPGVVQNMNVQTVEVGLANPDVYAGDELADGDLLVTVAVAHTRLLGCDRADAAHPEHECADAANRALGLRSHNHPTAHITYTVAMARTPFTRVTPP